MRENCKNLIIFLVQSLSCVRLFVTPWAVIPGFSDLHYHPEFAQTHVYWIIDASNHLILYHPLLLLLSIFPSIRIFPNESAFCISWPEYWSFNFNISPSSEYSGLISFRIDWLALLAESKGLSGVFLSNIIQKHQFISFFVVQFSHLYMTTGKTIDLNIQIFVDKVMSLLFNMLSTL